MRASGKPVEMRQGAIAAAAISLGNVKYLEVGELRVGFPASMRFRRVDELPSEEWPLRVHLRPITIAAPRPERWVLVAGNGRDLDAFGTEVTQAIGRQLASSGLGLITSGWPGVDEIVALAFADALKTRGAKPAVGARRVRFEGVFESPRSTKTPSRKSITKASSRSSKQRKKK